MDYSICLVTTEPICGLPRRLWDYIFVDLSVTASKWNAARSSNSNANSGTSMVKPGRSDTPYLGKQAG